MNIYIQYILAFGVLGLAAGNFFGSFGKGNRQGSTDVINFYKAEAANYKDMSDKKDTRHSLELKELTQEFNQKVHELTEKFGILQGQYNAEKAQREQYEAILKDRNPETEKFMAFMVDTQKEVVIILKEIHAMAKAEHDRDLNITATVTKV